MIRRGIDPLTVVGVITILHGLAHLVPVATAVVSDKITFRWPRNKSADRLAAPRDLVVAVFSACTVGFILGGLAATEWVVSPSWWRPFTDSAAVLSALGLVAFAHAYPSRFRYEWIGLAVDIVIIGNWLQIWDWPL